MICRIDNKGSSRNNSDHGAESSQELHSRDFQKILNACRSFFQVVRVDESNHLADGLYMGLPDECRRAWLSYDDQDHSVRLVVRLRDAGPTTQVQLLMLIRLQSSTKFARFVGCEQRDGLTLEAASMCPDPDRARPVVTRLSEGLRKVLLDDRLRVVVGG